MTSVKNQVVFCSTKIELSVSYETSFSLLWSSLKIVQGNMDRSLKSIGTCFLKISRVLNRFILNWRIINSKLKRINKNLTLNKHKGRKFYNILITHQLYENHSSSFLKENKMQITTHYLYKHFFSFHEIIMISRKFSSATWFINAVTTPPDLWARYNSELDIESQLAR